MAEYLVVPAPDVAPPALSLEAARAAIAQRWPAAVFPEPPPSVALTAWMRGPGEEVVLDVHPSRPALTVQSVHVQGQVAQWWADVIGVTVWLTAVSGLGYSPFAPADG
jgi:hypothetical protein